MTYGHLRADCLYTGISSGPNARYRVWESLYLYLYTKLTTQCFNSSAKFTNISGGMILQHTTDVTQMQVSNNKILTQLNRELWTQVSDTSKSA